MLMVPKRLLGRVRLFGCNFAERHSFLLGWLVFWILINTRFDLDFFFFMVKRGFLPRGRRCSKVFDLITINMRRPFLPCKCKSKLILNVCFVFQSHVRGSYGFSVSNFRNNYYIFVVASSPYANTVCILPPTQKYQPPSWMHLTQMKIL